jgi:hypothetical protein
MFHAACSLMGGQREVNRVGLSYWYSSDTYKQLCSEHKQEWAQTFWSLYDGYLAFVSSDPLASFYQKQPPYISDLDCWKVIQSSRTEPCNELQNPGDTATWWFMRMQHDDKWSNELQQHLAGSHWLYIYHIVYIYIYMYMYVCMYACMLCIFTEQHSHVMIHVYAAWWRIPCMTCNFPMASEGFYVERTQNSILYFQYFSCNWVKSDFLHKPYMYVCTFIHIHTHVFPDLCDISPPIWSIMYYYDVCMYV